MLRKPWCVLIGPCVLVLTACGDGGAGGGITEPTPVISLSLGASTLSLTQGQTGTVAVTISRSGGFSGPVDLSMQGAPAGLTAAFAPAPVASGTTTSTLTLTAAASLAPAAHTLTVHARGQGVDDKTALLTVSVAEAPGFRIAVDSSTLTLSPGGRASTRVSVARRGGFTGPVALSATGAPPGLTVTLDPARADGSGSELAVAASVGAAPGSFALTLRGSAEVAAGRTVTDSTTFTVSVQSVAAGRLVMIAAGEQHACALTATAEIHCWGNGVQGQLGDGRFPERQTTPVAVAGLRRWQQVTSGANHSCGVAADGEAYCWGNGIIGQLGSGSRPERQPTPVRVAGDHRWDRLYAGGNHTCGITTRDAAFCWGNTLLDSLFRGDLSVPRAVPGGQAWASFSGHFNHACGVTANGEAYCWGRGAAGQLGHGSTPQVQGTPVRVAGSAVWTQLAVGVDHTCGITADGETLCWGGNAFGALGDGSTTRRATPALVAGGHRWSAIGAGEASTCGLTVEGEAYCWGLGQSGELGNGTNTTRQLTPAPVAGGHAWTAIAVGRGFNCGITRSGDAYCWGRGNVGQLGDGSTEYRNVPVRVSDPR